MTQMESIELSERSAATATAFRWRRWCDPAVAVIATILGSVLSLAAIGHKSIWEDEAASIFFARDWSEMWQRLLSYESNMWLYYVLLHFWMRLGDSEGFLRGLSAVFSIATIPAVYGLGRRLAGSRVGAIAALLLATNHFFLRYAQEIRAYSLLMCLVVVSSYLFVEAVERRSVRFWGTYAFCAALGVYVHFFAALICLVHFLLLLAIGRSRVLWRQAATSAAVIALLLLPLLAFQPLRSDQLAWLRPRTLYNLIEFFRFATGSWPLLFLYSAFWAWAILSGWRRPSSGTFPSSRWCYLFIVVWALLPALATYAFSVGVMPVLINRYLIISLPALVLLTAAGISRLSRPWIQVAVVVVLLSLAARCVHWHYAGYQKQDWRGTTSWVLSEARPGDVVGFSIFMGKPAFGYYLVRMGIRNPPFAVLDLYTEARHRSDPRWRLDSGLLAALPARYQRVWLIVPAHIDQRDRDTILDSLQAHYACKLERQFTHIHVLLFEKAS